MRLAGRWRGGLPDGIIPETRAARLFSHVPSSVSAWAGNERYGVRDGIGIDEDTRSRDDSQETGDDRQGQGERTVSSRAVLSGVIERMNCSSMVLVSGSECGDQHIDVGNHRSAASSNDRLLEPSMPGRRPPDREETGNGLRGPPRDRAGRSFSASASSIIAASVVRSLSACAAACASSLSGMSTVAFTYPSYHARGRVETRLPCRAIAQTRTTAAPRAAPPPGSRRRARRGRGSSRSGSSRTRW